VVRIRDIRPSDREQLGTAWLTLSPETQRKRFLTAKPRLTSAELDYLTDVDGRRHVAIVAVDSRDRILGVARYIRLPEDPGTAEFAILVGDAFQGRGIGTALADELTARAQAAGVEGFTALVLHDNVAAQRVIRRIGERFATTMQVAA
jgi:RimJ/RimL family protein N-acetyltransferase